MIKESLSIHSNHTPTPEKFLEKPKIPLQDLFALKLIIKQSK